MKVAISQSNYIPWKGYFDMINCVDIFVVFDEVQFTRRDWRNRNKIKSPNGTNWLTIPVESKGKYYQKISETLVSDHSWAQKHWQSISNFYRKAKYFKKYSSQLRDTYEKASTENHLSKINMLFIEMINDILGIGTEIRQSSEFELVNDQTGRLLNICKDLNADYYLSGPAAKGYLDVNQFSDEKIKVDWMEYSSYPEYSQLFGQFEHAVSILDMIFNIGPETPKYMKSFQK
ncbi:MAG: hypothetical protein C0623_11985 [Desulfuromonas sp.]|nr:MAG: hypothetical protein C0623_11985 [Desulfuromonas sp.]